MQCGRCGRKLKDPESIRIGYGPTCRAMMGIKTKEKVRKAGKSKTSASKEQEAEGNIPGQMSIMNNPDWLPDGMKGGSV